MSARIDQGKTKKVIKLVLDKIEKEADPWLLNEYHNLFKKEVSLFNRSKVAACLLMLYDQGKTLHMEERNTSRKSGRTNDTQRYPLAEEESKRLFFSVGRSRRVFPREILGLINAKTAIPKEDIGAIRILDNYSFVQVRDTVAEQIIEACNGYIFRGRPLTVNYAKSRKDEENNIGNGEAFDDDDYSEDGHFREYDETENDDTVDLEQSQDHTEEENI